MPPEEPTIQRPLLARIVAENRHATDKITPADARQLLAAVRRQRLSAADETAARASR
jgi:hypothetical protein